MKRQLCLEMPEDLEPLRRSAAAGDDQPSVRETLGGHVV
jgi:hypothetical protein